MDVDVSWFREFHPSLTLVQWIAVWLIIIWHYSFTSDRISRYVAWLWMWVELTWNNEVNNDNGGSIWGRMSFYFAWQIQSDGIYARRNAELSILIGFPLSTVQTHVTIWSPCKLSSYYSCFLATSSQKLESSEFDRTNFLFVI